VKLELPLMTGINTLLQGENVIDKTKT